MRSLVGIANVASFEPGVRAVQRGIRLYESTVFCGWAMRRTIPIIPASGLPDAPAQAAKGRGTVLLIAHRFEQHRREAGSDGWDEVVPDDGDARAAPRTEVREQQVRRMLSRNASPDIPFDLAANPYRGCEHVMWNSVDRRRLQSAR